MSTLVTWGIDENDEIMDVQFEMNILEVLTTKTAFLAVCENGIAFIWGVDYLQVDISMRIELGDYESLHALDYRFMIKRPNDQIEFI